MNASTNSTNNAADGNNANDDNKPANKKSLYQKFVDFPTTTVGKITGVVLFILLTALALWACDGNLLCIFLVADKARRHGRSLR